ncbi:beta-N-acetylhexosaminidase [Methylomarinovum caldicuralii]|uniref:Beta-hexosaminidase n=1 Tax=Methylomarinovum caldicuralii TaxID=438856 RepID=A0AAU9C3E9_9GAMM|nr:beta-N-acetylhexosaminidase [Methylomarinovum caldicuralii]BCX82982.1 beta-N-acetylhexosaminidase [Methylomarinovum caldicuralii]
MTESVAGPFMLDLEGPELTAEEREWLGHPGVGGIILFARNYVEPAQVRDLIVQIRQAVGRPLLIAVDQEGGRVQRFQRGFTRLPPAARYGEVYADDPARGLALAEQAGFLMAAELRAVGVDLSFAPVLDVDSGVSEVIGDRAFATEPAAVAALADAFACGMRRAGMAAVGKHFPGHGGVAADSHQELPVDRRSLAQLEMRDLLPFQRLIEAGLEAVMCAHVVYPQIDPLPAGFSRFWLQTVLRQRLGFGGAVFSDDLAMAGAAGMGDLQARAEVALAGGCDMLLACNCPQESVALLDRVAWRPEPARHRRLAALRARPVTPDPARVEAARRQLTAQA